MKSSEENKSHSQFHLLPKDYFSFSLPNGFARGIILDQFLTEFKKDCNLPQHKKSMFLSWWCKFQVPFFNFLVMALGAKFSSHPIPIHLIRIH